MVSTILVIGKTGQLAKALARLETETPYEFIFLSREQFDLNASTKEILQELAEYCDVDVILIAAAYTSVDAAEDNPDLAFQANSQAPKIIAKFCKEHRIPLLHISTDYVFSGQQISPYRPSDKVSPINIYGESKHEGELAILKSGATFIILRTSWVYDTNSQNFFTTMRRLAKSKTELNVVSDQVGRPTYAPHLAKACLKIIGKLLKEHDRVRGIYHATGGGPIISWAGFAQAIFEGLEAKLENRTKVNPISSAEYPTRAKRPPYSVLDNDLFERVFEYTLPDWREGLKEALKADDLS